MPARQAVADGGKNKQFRQCPEGTKAGVRLGAWLTGSPSVGGFDFAWLAQLGSLAILPFAHEDLAIIAGAYFITHQLLPAGLVALSIYGGIVASDFALYGLGAGARHVPWLRQYIDIRAHHFSEKLRENIFGLVALCRFVPGIVFVAFVACGWTRVPLSRFTLASLIVSAIYLPLTLFVVIEFGVALDDVLGIWAWPLLLGALTASGLLRKRVFAFRAGGISPAAAVRPAIAFAGMPALAGGARGVAAAERIPPAVFYLPLVANWLRLAARHRSLTLPAAANPAIPSGGMWGESKSAYFDDIAAQWRDAVACYCVVACGPDALAGARAAMRAAGLFFPIVAKPDIGWHGYGVQRIADAAGLAGYLRDCAPGSRVILQAYVADPGEAAVLYARRPGQRGAIRSLTFRYFPHVVGDGTASVRELIARDPRARWKAHLHLGRDASHRGLPAAELARVPACGEVVRIALIGNQRAGSLYRDGRACITAALEQRFDAVACAMTEFHYGRFDFRFRSVEALMRGEDFRIVEINGIGGEAIDAWDPALTWTQTYRRLLAEQEVLFEIGARNRARGFRPEPARRFLGLLAAQTRMIRNYPPSH